MAEDTRVKSLECFKLSGIKHTGKPLGQGSYGHVVELIYRELKCAGKKLMPVLRENTTKEEEQALLKNAKKECVTLSMLKHPNIVQFLGVHFEEGDPIPMLVMEYVPYTLSSFIDRHKTLPPEISYGILVDVARALCYLHGGEPIIVHRDLSANNVLLTFDLRAKVSDLGTARILDVSVSEKFKRCQIMSRCPGTPIYMPPEAHSEKPLCDETLDCFSYGVLILHILSGEWPVPIEGIRNELHQVVVLNEVDRRQKYIEKIDENHPLMGLMYNCLDHKSKRPSAKAILEKVLEVQKQCCRPQPDKMTLLTQQEKDAKRKATLEEDIGQLGSKLKRLEHLHSMEAKEKAKEVERLEGENEMLRSLVEIRNTEQEALESRVQKKTEMVQKREEEIAALKQKMDEEIDAVKRSVREELHAYQKEKDEKINAKEMELNAYKEKLLKKEKIIDEAIERNNDRARKAHEDLHRNESEKGAVMEYLRSGTQMHLLHHRAKQLKWKHGPRFPMGMTAPQCVLIKSSLYVGGGQTLNTDREFRSSIFEYDMSNSNGMRWSCPFTQCPTMYFGLGELNGRLVVVGGEREAEDKPATITGEVFVPVENGTKWSGDVVPAMKVPRIRSCVVSFRGGIAACGGIESSNRECSSAVEIYRPGDKEWCVVTSLPAPRAALRVSIIHKTAYFLGGFYPSLARPGKPNCISIDLEDLFQADATVRRRWNDTFRDAPCHSSAPASLCGSLIALGGLEEHPIHHTDAIYAYSPVVNEWHLIDRLNIKLSSATAITLPSGELIVLGGKTGDDRNTDVYIGSLE